MPNERGALWPLMLAADQQGRDDMCLVSASGVRLRFADGSERLCGTSGLWNCILGYGNAAVADAAAAALRDASYLSVWSYENDYARRAAAALVELAGAEHYGRVLFSTSGGSANDLVMKLARHYHALKGDTKRKGIIGMEGGYHGLTFGAFALTTSKLGQKMYGVDRRLVAHVPPNDNAALAELMQRYGEAVAAVVVEPVLGTGAVPLSEEYVAELLRLRSEYGYLLIADEVSTGFCRIDGYFATQKWPEPPDALIVAKALTNGTAAASAVIVSHRVADAFLEADAILGHAETQAGTPIVGASILATLSEMERLNAVELSRNLSGRLDTVLAGLVADVPWVSSVSGRGCLRHLALCTSDGTLLDQSEVAPVVSAIRDAGALVHPGPNGIQLIPALVYTGGEVDELASCITDGLTKYAQGRPGV